MRIQLSKSFEEKFTVHTVKYMCLRVCKFSINIQRLHKIWRVYSTVGANFNNTKVGVGILVYFFNKFKPLDALGVQYHPRELVYVLVSMS